VRVRHACGVRWAWRITVGLCHTFPWCCHSNATRAPIANPPNSAQLGGIPQPLPKLHPGPCNSVAMQPRTDRHTDACDHNTFLVVYDSYAKCKNLLNSSISSTCPHNMVNFGTLTAESGWRVWGTLANFNGHLYSAGRPSRWASAHILVVKLL